MKSTRRVLSLVLAVIMLFSAFSVVASAKEIEVAQTSANFTGGQVLYLKPNSNWVQSDAWFAAYIWGTSGNTWVKMESCPRDSGYYKMTAPSGTWGNVIFTRMNPSKTSLGWDSKWDQTADLTWDGTNCLFTVGSGQWNNATGSWSNWTETADPTDPPVVDPDDPEVEETEPEATTPEETQPEETQPEETQPEETQPEETQPEETEPEEVGTIKVYFQNNWMWSDVKVYFWGSATTNSAEWPGDTPQLYANDGTYDVYVAEVPADITAIIFNGFDGGINSTNQTPDIKDFYDGACYSMVWNDKNDVVVNDIEDIVVPEIPTQPEETQPEETQPAEKVETVTGLKATDITRKSFTLTWDAIEGAKKYWVYLNGKIYHSATENTLTVNKNEVGAEYTVCVTAYIDDYITKVEDAETITVKTLDYVYSYEASADPYEIHLKYSADDCTKAWVYVGTDPENLKIYHSSTNGEFTIKNRESNTKYYVKITYLIDGYILDNNEVFEVTTPIDEALVITANVVEDGITVDWNALDGATNYWVTCETAEKTSIYKTTDTNFVIPNVTGDCTVSVKTIVNKQMVYFYSVDL